MSDDYLMAWVCYVLSAGVLMLVAWRLTQLIPLTDLRTIIRVLSFALLFTPAQLDDGAQYWAPAFMAALIDMVTISVQAGLARLWPLLGSMLGLVVLSFVWRTYRYKQDSKPQTDGSAG